MRKVYYMVCMLAALSVIISCEDFLDKMPDKRAEINSNQKISELLVSAYPNVDPMMIYEHRTDNVMDNGRRFGEPERMIVENYFWEDISETDWDAPEALWNSCYGAIAAANQALDAIRKLGPDLGNGPQRERLFCAGLMLTSCWSTHSVSRIVKVLQVQIWEFLMWKNLRQLSENSMTEEQSLPYMKRFPVI